MSIYGSNTDYRNDSLKDKICLVSGSGNVVQYTTEKINQLGGKMSQNAMRIKWSRDEVETKLKGIMQSIHHACLDAAEEYGTPGNYVNGANIAGFVKVADAMMDQGIV